jgi:hypothetical protein
MLAEFDESVSRGLSCPPQRLVLAHLKRPTSVVSPGLSTSMGRVRLVRSALRSAF